MITDITTEVCTDKIKLDELLNAKSPLPSILHETIRRECGHLMLADEILSSENTNHQAIKAASHLLKMDHLDRLIISPTNLPKDGAFLEKMLVEAKKSSSRFALELLGCLHNLIDELFLDPQLSEKSQVMKTFLRNFQRFTRHHLETKIS